MKLRFHGPGHDYRTKWLVTIASPVSGCSIVLANININLHVYLRKRTRILTQLILNLSACVMFLFAI